MVKNWQRNGKGRKIFFFFFKYCFVMYSRFGFMGGRTQLDVEPED